MPEREKAWLILADPQVPTTLQSYFHQMRKKTPLSVAKEMAMAEAIAMAMAKAKPEAMVMAMEGICGGL